MTPNDMLADAVLNCRPLAARYLPGFTDTNRISQAVNLPNHVAWSLGHCALTMHRVAEMADGAPVPTSDFDAGGAVGHSGDAPRAFSPEAVSFGSRPVADANAYPGLARCIEIYNAACERLAAAVRSAPEATFIKVIKWGPAEAPWWMLVFRMVFHNGFHTGQIADLRRALGLKSIFS